MIRVLVGCLLIAAGLSGRFVFLGTDSPLPLIALGVGLVCFGGYQIVRARSDRSDGIQ